MKEYGGAEDFLLAELQFAFIAFLVGQSLEAFLQWKTLIVLFFGCAEAFIKAIYYQLKFGLQKDDRDTVVTEKRTSILLDESWLSADSFLHHLCKTRKLEELLEESLGWNFQQISAVGGIYFEEGDEGGI